MLIPKNKGFTLVEIMVVMGIIGLLSLILFPFASAYMRDGRDAERTVSIAALSRTLESYFNYNKKYPTPTPDGCIPQDILAPTNASPSQTKQPQYIDPNIFPESPRGDTYDEGCGPNGRYAYGVTSDGYSYILLAKMEGEKGGNYSGPIDGFTGAISQTGWTNAKATNARDRGIGRYYVWTNGDPSASAFTPTTIVTTQPPAVINGACGMNPNSCTTGTSTGYSAGSCGGQAAWTCSGENGGTNISCNAPSPTTCGNCTFNGNSVAHGGSVIAYDYSTVPYGTSCDTVKQTRTCTNGVLNGSATNATCTPAPPASCTTPWGTTVAHGSTVTAYQSASVPFGGTCTSETRTCTNGALSGNYTNSGCTVSTVNNCTAGTYSGYTVSSLNHTQALTVTKTDTTTPPNGKTTYTATANCNNGNISIVGESSSIACNAGYALSGGVCVQNTQSATCTGLPQNASWNTATTITQTLVGGVWTPSATGSYNTTASTTSCNYKCNADSDWIGNTCVKRPAGMTYASNSCYGRGAGWVSGTRPRATVQAAVADCQANFNTNYLVESTEYREYPNFNTIVGDLSYPWGIRYSCAGSNSYGGVVCYASTPAPTSMNSACWPYYNTPQWTYSTVFSSQHTSLGCTGTFDNTAYYRCCIPASQICTITNGQGSQTWNTSTNNWNTCTVTSCNAGYTISGNSCVVTNQTRSCAITNGQGSQTSTNGGATWGACTVTSCNAGYTISGNSCVVTNQTRSCAITNGQGSQTSTNGGATWGACTVTSCNAGYTISGNSCVVTNQTRSCAITNGQGSQTSTNGGATWGACTVTSCNAGYEQYANGCYAKNLNFTISYTSLTNTNERLKYDFAVSGAPPGSTLSFRRYISGKSLYGDGTVMKNKELVASGNYGTVRLDGTFNGSSDGYGACGSQGVVAPCTMYVEGYISSTNITATNSIEVSPFITSEVSSSSPSIGSFFTISTVTSDPYNTWFCLEAPSTSQCSNSNNWEQLWAPWNGSASSIFYVASIGWVRGGQNSYWGSFNIPATVTLGAWKAYMAIGRNGSIQRSTSFTIN